MALPCVVIMICSCQIFHYTNNYFIPEHYRGWLIVRHLPERARRPIIVDYYFNTNGFCTSHFKFDYFCTTNYYFKSAARLTKVDNMSLHHKTRSDVVYVWDFGTEGPADRPKYKDEHWEMHFVGTLEEYLAARDTELDFLASHHLYDKAEPEPHRQPD
jgi:hypothetical protein